MIGIVYIASKAHHGGKWKQLRTQGYPFVSTWIDECGIGETKSWSDLWMRCIREAAQAKGAKGITT